MEPGKTHLQMVKEELNDELIEERLRSTLKEHVKQRQKMQYNFNIFPLSALPAGLVRAACEAPRCRVDAWPRCWAKL